LRATTRAHERMVCRVRKRRLRRLEARVPEELPDGPGQHKAMMGVSGGGSRRDEVVLRRGIDW